MKTAMSSLLLCTVLASAMFLHADEVSPFLRKTGGTITEPMDGKPGVLIVNAQTDASTGRVAALAEAMQGLMRIPFRVTVVESARKDWPDTAAMLVSGENKVGVVVLCESDALPSLLVAPEARWSIVNVAALKADAPEPDVLESRISKQLWRATAYALGAANAGFPVCLMKPVFHPKDLDALGVNQISLEPMPAIGQNLQAMGIALARRSTYRRACEEGWAPPPANEIQQAIWDEVQGQAQ